VVDLAHHLGEVRTLSPDRSMRQLEMIMAALGRQVDTGYKLVSEGARGRLRVRGQDLSPPLL
jgi:hypothetical protein